MEKPTEMSKDIHSFIHLFTKRSLSSNSVPGARDTERRPRRPWGREAEARPTDSASLLQRLAFLGDTLLLCASQA